jgi:hypothetical protein
LPDTEFPCTRLSSSPWRNMPMSPLSETEFRSIRTALDRRRSAPPGRW